VQVLYKPPPNARRVFSQDSTPPSASAPARTERSVVFTVTDSGPGIPADMKDKVFNWFESRSQGSRHRGGRARLSLVALLCRAAWRQDPGGFDRGQGHGRDLRLPDRPGGASRRRRMTAPTTFSVALHNETATAQLMADLALLVGSGDVITLTGDLGAGKTAAARAHDPLSRRRRGAGSAEPDLHGWCRATSCRHFPVMHADLYRVEDESELEEIGLAAAAGSKPSS